jgi:hypothetical protein
MKADGRGEEYHGGDINDFIHEGPPERAKAKLEEVGGNRDRQRGSDTLARG